MKTATLGLAIGLLSSVIIIISAFKSNEIRSNIFNLNQKDVTLSGDAFSGFYYDTDDNSSTEKLALRFRMSAQMKLVPL